MENNNKKTHRENVVLQSAAVFGLIPPSSGRARAVTQCVDAS